MTDKKNKPKLYSFPITATISYKVSSDSEVPGDGVTIHNPNEQVVEFTVVVSAATKEEAEAKKMIGIEEEIKRNLKVANVEGTYEWRDAAPRHSSFFCDDGSVYVISA